MFERESGLEEDMAFEISIPSKTFLVGEYLALGGGPAIILTTEPSFRLRVSDSSEGQSACQGIWPGSPGGKYIRKENDFFRGKNIDFRDPHRGKGGFGASSAQFALCYYLTHFSKFQLGREEDIDLEDLLKTYQDVAWSGKGTPPSGADVISQLVGSEISFFQITEGKVQFETCPWPFRDLDFLVVRTGKKLATHQHLSNLDLKINQKIQKVTNLTWQSLKLGASSQFIDGVNEFSEFLNTEGLVAKETKHLIDQIKNWQGVKAVKGCGALGADTLMLVVTRHFSEEILTKLKDLSLPLVATSKDLSRGLTLQPFHKTKREGHSFFERETHL